MTFGQLFLKFECNRMVKSKVIRKVHIIFDHPTYTCIALNLKEIIKNNNYKIKAEQQFVLAVPCSHTV